MVSAMASPKEILRINDREVAVFEGKGWGHTPVRIGIGDPDLDPGLVLFAAYVVRFLADDAGAVAASAGT